MLTYTWEHTVSIAVLDTIGLVANIWFLYTIKMRESYNAIDVLQALKTVSCLLALVICVWLEVATCSAMICTATKAIMDDLFIFSTCYAFLAIAYIRRKVCMCRGRASVLITNRYAMKTMFICFMPVAMFVAVNLTLMSGNQRSPSSSTMLLKNDTDKATDSELLVGYSKMAYELCHLLILVIVPLSISTVLYLKICFAITRTARRMGGSMTQRQRDPSKIIMTSVILLLFTVLSVWAVFVIAKIVSLLLSINDVFYLYWKIAILVASPIGDGLLQHSKRKKGQGGIAVPSRAVPRVYPLRTPSSCVSPTANSYENLSLSEKLPVLIEETTLHTAHDNDENVRELAEPKAAGYIIKKRRQSIMHHPRASVLVRNAAVIGLEFQERTKFAKYGRQRKASQEKLKAELENIESVAINRQRTRRLSNCLRFSVVDEPGDEVYHIYKQLYDRRGSKYSEKSARGADDQDSVPGFKALSSASIRSDKDRKLSDSSSCMNSPSTKRWKRLFTTARSAKRFSEMRKHNADIVIEEEATHDHPKRQSRGNIITRQNKVSVFSMAQHAKYANNAPLRRSLDDHSTNRRKDDKIHRNKKRSISCVNNDWAKEKDGENSRKHSVTFIANSTLDGPSTSHLINRSFSYDTQFYLDYMQDDQKKTKKHVSRYSHGDVRSQRPSNSTTKVQRWLCKETTSRDECIANLTEMKKYF